MQTNKVISVNVIGERTGRVYAGDFTVKLIMSQKDEFQADLRRRVILGPSPEGTPPAPNLQWKAFMFGQLQSRTMEAPTFWTDADNGLDIPDANVVTAVYDALLKAEDDFENAIKKDSEDALKRMQKKNKKEKEEEKEDDSE